MVGNDGQSEATKRALDLQQGLQQTAGDLRRLAALWPNLPQGARKAILDLAASLAPDAAPEGQE